MVDDDSPENVTDEADGPIEGVRIIGPKEAIEVTSRDTDQDEVESSESTPSSGSNPTDYGAVPVVKIDDMDTSGPKVDLPEAATKRPSGRSKSGSSGKKQPASASERAPLSDDSYELPHYSDPPTGQVPKVVIGDDPNATWTELADQPRWRETDREFSEQDFSDLVGSEPAIAESDEPFDDDSDQDEIPREPRLTSAASAGTTGADEARRKRITEPELFDAGSDLTEDDVSLAGRRSSSVRAVPAEPHFDGLDLSEEVDSGDHSDDGSDSDDVAVVAPRPGPRRRVAPDSTGGAKSGDRNLGVAAGVGIGLVAVGIACFMLGSLATTILATIILSIAGHEFFVATETAGYRPARFPGMVAIAALVIAPLYGGFFAYPVVFGLTVIVSIIWYQQVQGGTNMVMNLGVTLLGVAYVGFLGSFATLGLGVARPFERSEVPNQGIGLLFAAVLVAVCHDVGAYFAGKHLGHRPLSASSPNKTLEGTIGGIVVATFIPTIVIGVVGISPVGEDIVTAFAFSLVCALIAPIGDLCESAIKRDLGVKDMGAILPGHGGVLDRFDALLFVLPTAYFMAHLLEIGAPVVF